MSQKVPQHVLAYDLGGTKVSVGVVDSSGRVLKETRTPVLIEEGKKAVLKQLSELGRAYLQVYPDIQVAGLASAGPLDPIRGVLMDPTNFVSKKHGGWGNVPIGRILSKSLGIPVVLENDAAAAILAEHWVGAAKNVKNAMILTLGTGLGTGVMINGKLVRAGRNLHTEAGHVILNADDRSVVCNCGNVGDAEAYLSGNGFARWASRRMKNPKLSAKEIADLARKKNPAAVKVFAEYSELMAAAIQNYVVCFAPEVIIFTGSFAQTADLFLKPTQMLLKKMLKRRRVGIDLMPKLVLSKLENQAGLIGGGYVAFHPEH